MTLELGAELKKKESLGIHKSRKMAHLFRVKVPPRILRSRRLKNDARGLLGYHLNMAHPRENSNETFFDDHANSDLSDHVDENEIGSEAKVVEVQDEVDDTEDGNSVDELDQIDKDMFDYKRLELSSNIPASLDMEYQSLISGSGLDTNQSCSFKFPPVYILVSCI